MSSLPPLTLIAAVARNGALGRNNQLLWHLPEDMKYFREATRGAIVIMGRKTWESLPAKFRPLPGRRNIVISRQQGYNAPGAETVSTLAEALSRAEGQPAFVIGGGEIYALAMPLAQRLMLTEVDLAPEADAFFPPVPAHWQEISRTPGISENGLGFAFVTYSRAP